jgi:hypothetical protein
MGQLTTELFFDRQPHIPVTIRRGMSHRAVNNFSDQRFKLADIDHLGRFVGERCADAAECLPVFAAIGSKPVSAFKSLAALHAEVHGDVSKPSETSILVTRDMLLLGVDRRLQEIYREFFHTNPPQLGASHEQKIAMLEATRHNVLAVLNAYDWQWLAEWLDIGRVGETAESSVMRLANFAFSINQVSFLFTEHCNISCQHCYNNSSPHKKAKRIPLDKMLAIVAEMPKTDITCLGITGGEPFLYPQDILALIKAGRAAGLKRICINTNGFWASTDERTKQMLDTLAGAGFMQAADDIIKVSAGVYHHEFLAFDHALTLARHYYDRFGKPLSVDYELPLHGGLAVAGDVRKMIGALGLAERVELCFRGVDSVGRAKGLGGIDRAPTQPNCRELSAILFNLDETVSPCLGVGHEGNGISVGRSDRHGLKDLIKRMQNDPILQFIAANPWDDIFALAAKGKRQEGYAGKCDMCLHSLGDLTDKEPLQAALFPRQNFYPFWFTLSAN